MSSSTSSRFLVDDGDSEWRMTMTMTMMLATNLGKKRPRRRWEEANQPNTKDYSPCFSWIYNDHVMIFIDHVIIHNDNVMIIFIFSIIKIIYNYNAIIQSSKTAFGSAWNLTNHLLSNEQGGKGVDILPNIWKEEKEYSLVKGDYNWWCGCEKKQRIYQVHIIFMGIANIIFSPGRMDYHEMGVPVE